MLTCQQVMDRMWFSLSGDVHPRVGTMTLANLAGTWVMASRPWAWSTRTASVDAVPGATQIYLPSDYHGMVSVAGRIFGDLEMTSAEEVIQAREQSFGLQQLGSYIGFMSFTETDAGDMIPVIEIYPSIPTSGVTTIGTIAYTAAWRPFNKPEDKARIPSFMDPLLLSAADAYALGYERPKGGTVAQRLAEVMLGPEWMAATSADDQMQSDFGRMEGGYQESPRSWKSGWQFTAGDPS